MTLTPQYHYCRLLITPLRLFDDSATPLKPIDRISLQQILQSSVNDLYGPMGGSATSLDVDIVTVDEPKLDQVGQVVSAGVHDVQRDDEGTRFAVVRVPSKAAHNVMTAFTFGRTTYDGQLYRIEVVSHSQSLANLSGHAGQGMSGFERWSQSLLQAR
ncbi:hypothetical protein ACM66B_007041 [Microbotryomycetes sp. NB124-2]